MKVTNNMVKALSFTLGLSMAILMMFLTDFGLNTSLQRSDPRNALDLVRLPVFIVKYVKSNHIVRPCDATGFQRA